MRQLLIAALLLSPVSLLAAEQENNEQVWHTLHFEKGLTRIKLMTVESTLGFKKTAIESTDPRLLKVAELGLRSSWRLVPSKQGGGVGLFAPGFLTLEGDGRQVSIAIFPPFGLEIDSPQEDRIFVSWPLAQVVAKLYRQAHGIDLPTDQIDRLSGRHQQKFDERLVNKLFAEPAWPGKASQWEGFTRHDFSVDGVGAIVVEPKEALPGKPWLWRGEFFGAFANADVALVRAGWHVVYLSVPNQFGSPKAMAKWEKFYDLLVKEHGLHPKPGLCGMSRGGLYVMAWAALHPDKTLAVWLDNAVCDFKSWPGGKAKGPYAGPGTPGEWQNLLKAFDFKDDAEALAYKQNPVDHLEPVAKAKIPILLVYGDSDKVVPHKENSEIVYDRYLKLGGPATRIVKPGQDHHPHGLADPQPIVDFFMKARIADTTP